MCVVLKKDGKDTVNSFALRNEANPAYDPLSKPNTLNDLILDSIDDALSGLLGVRGRDLIYDHIARNYSFGREDIPLHMDQFLALLEKTFSSGSRTIGRTILRHLYDKLDWEFVIVSDYKFEDYLEAARAKIGLELFERARIKHKEAVGKSETTT